jgi:hypothetical protein
MGAALNTSALMILAVACLSTAAQAGPTAGAHARSCAQRASHEGLKGAARRRFQALCLRGALPREAATHPVSRDLAARTITAPSGEDPASRSDQCDAEGAKRGLHDSGLQSFRKSCLASAAPVGAVGAKDRPTTPTPAKPPLDALTDAPRS